MHRNVKQARTYGGLGEIKDNRSFVFGSIWQIRDNLIKIPNADRLNQRKYHFTRCVIIVDNTNENFNGDSFLISIAPISSKVKFKRKFDIEIDSKNDKVLDDSIIMLDYVQPVLKKDLFKCVGEISVDKKYELLESMMTKMGIETEEQVAMGDENK